jgi:hypothetical protein
MDLKLSPCPFCGGEATFEEIAGRSAPEEIRWSVGCKSSEGQTTGIACIGYMSVMTYARRTDAAKAWNSRVYVLEEQPSSSAGEKHGD